MSETNNNSQGQKTKFWAMAVLSVLWGVLALLILIFCLDIELAAGLAILGLATGVLGLRWTGESDDKRGGCVAAIFGIIVNGLLVSVCLLWLVASFFYHHPRPAYRSICASNLSGLGKAMGTYANNYGNKYPAPDKWCDLLVESDYATEKQFICKAAARQGDTSRCHYAINPNAEPNSPGDMVLLFETKGGWNQVGGPEILTTENHGGKGCNILFNDGRVKFVETKDLGKLKWKVEEGK